MLHELVDYARRKGIAGEAGFTAKAVRWLLNFTPDGQYLGLIDLTDRTSKRPRPRIFANVPHLKFSGDTGMRQFLVDTAQYALLYGEDEPSAKLLSKHAYFLRLLRDAAEVEPILARIADALDDPAVRAAICRELADQSPKAKPSDNVTFAVVGPDQTRTLVEETTWHEWWRAHFPGLFPKRRKAGAMRCLLSGELAEPCRTHPKIKGLGDVGGNVETTLIGFNLDAFCSYGLKQSSNAAVSSEMAEQYAACLNSLIADSSRRLAGAKVVYWYVGERAVPPEDDVVAELLAGLDFGEAEVQEDHAEAPKPTPQREEAQALSRAAQLLDAIRTGKRPDLRNCRYCAMTLSGNAGRVVVRDWMQGQFQDLAENVKAWFADLSIIRRDGLGLAPRPKFLAVLGGLVRDLKELPAPLETALWRAAAMNQPIPYEAMARALARTRVDFIQDNPSRHARMGLLKAFLRRKELCPMEPQLNEQLHHPAYVCGRIMAALGAIQYKALGDVGAGVVQRYYAAASATPGLVLGRLVRLAQTGHLPKIEPVGLRRWYENQLAEVWGLLKQAPPRSLTLEEQTLFAMGFYHQKARRTQAEPEAQPEKE
jgi:CRISPR-associated protein Csd1